jgi:hypothetical protein
MSAANDAPEILLQHHLKTLKLPTMLREYEKLARQCAAENADHVRYLARMIELELLDREARMIDRRIKAARFPAIKSLESFDFDAIPTLNKKLVLDLARGEFVSRRENVIALGPSGVGKTHVATGLGLTACQRGIKTRFVTASAIVHEMIEAHDERRLLCLQRQLATVELLIIPSQACKHALPGNGRTWLRASFQDWCGAVVRTHKPALRAWCHDNHFKPALRRMDRRLRRRTPYRRAARPACTPCPYPRDECALIPLLSIDINQLFYNNIF